MDGIHDMGGMHGFGRVMPEPNEPVFHADWEKRVFAMTLAVPFVVVYSDDHFRREIERMEPGHYLTSSYYEKWLAAVEAMLNERGVLVPGELEGGPGKPLPANIDPANAATPEIVPGAIAGGASQGRADPNAAPPRYKVGDRVKTADIMPYGHTRLPRYVRGKVGTIVRLDGRFIFADSHSALLQENPTWTYTLEFAASDLWGAEANPRDTLRIAVWEPYIAGVVA